MTTRKKSTIIFFALAIIIGGIFFARYQMYYSHGSVQTTGIFEITKGEGNAQIAGALEKQGLISSEILFWTYMETHGMLNKIIPGEYLLNGSMTIPDIAATITNQHKEFEKVLFKEGWTAKQMAQELDNHGYDGAAFLQIVKNPSVEIISQYPILLTKPAGASLEGYLFPDTYYFSSDATPEGIIKKILDNTEQKLGGDMLAEAKNQSKSFFDVLTMASIVEGEVRTDADRKVVAGIFWKRIANGQRLQSDATLEYVLGTNELQHSISETQTASAYNTYRSAGLPPGPVSNPGLSSLDAALNPTTSDYNYFLTDPKTGTTVFAATYAEHLANKAKYGL